MKNPWISKAILLPIKKRHKLFKSYFLSKNPDDITVCMDVERNPGPDVNDVISASNKEKQIIRYSQYELICLHKVGKKPSYDIIETLKANRIFKYRGSRGRRIRNVGGSRIPVVIGRRPFKPVRPKTNAYANLIKIRRTRQDIMQYLNAYF